MSKSSQQRPGTPSKASNPEEKGDDWSDQVCETVVSCGRDGTLNALVIDGGSDNGLFPYLGAIQQDKINYIESGKRLEEGDILLEIQCQKVAGYTQRDVIAWLNHCCRNSAPVSVKTARKGEFFFFIGKGHVIHRPFGPPMQV